MTQVDSSWTDFLQQSTTFCKIVGKNNKDTHAFFLKHNITENKVHSLSEETAYPNVFDQIEREGEGAVAGEDWCYPSDNNRGHRAMLSPNYYLKHFVIICKRVMLILV